MRILVSNDDGYFAPGITLLAEALRQMGEVTVVAPERDRSGASNSLTLDRPLTVRRAPNGYFSVNGTPTDCVHIAVTGLHFLPDVIVSGVNLGANMGDDTIYSGTVAAAAEATCSAFRRWRYPSPARPASISKARSASRCRSWSACGTSRFRAGPAQRQRSRRARDAGWCGNHAARAPAQGRAGGQAADPARRDRVLDRPAGGAADAGPGTDFHAVEAGRVSVTPLRMDLTHNAQLPRVAEWIAP